MGKHFDTKSVHLSGIQEKKINSKSTPIYQTSAFKFKDLEDLENFYQGKNDYLYTRVGNPNTDELGAAVAQLEGAPRGIAAASGTAAILAGILAVAKQGDHVIAATDIYGGTYQLLANELPDLGIEVSFIDFAEGDKIADYIQGNTKMVYSESVSNPLLRKEDIESLVTLAQEAQLVLMVDNTFATPYLCRPYEQGADLVVHSATKYIGGHSDITAGVLVGHEGLIEKANQKIVNLGSSLSPFEAWLTCRGLKTLSVRMERHVDNAQKLADALKKHEAVEKVYYPEDVSPHGNGAIVTMDITATCDVETFFQSLGWIKIVPTLAGVETSVSYPLATSHRALSPEMHEQLGITEGLIRISVGIEAADDIIEGFNQALNQARRT
ncbi:aminotransferase class I/II-fold pyridoxal phosphate-dependent enzyme [Sediminibacillus dalangtanensis]|uniref:Aminotransferase class I/II-fold pyridoxal phosphate-dependent enzyme n=1 Tax=Sediminibacillus dalangtanensis TaxID=2729421 RepID=A0ABX7W0A1_9BACI|nr:aminotransferase class I/II-fold pyridoxal phosphate-dependent enzyme [Sediminibacillus dalangtanensis]QTN00497.1 aminotransferase class I/II-fold pyridoxal phosphate-dependent enzyme [Sediminibacillus dalangtanensis]